jgi:group II intron reverse transcriptase/maturase
MSLEKIDAIISALREERYHWQPARHGQISTKSGEKHPSGIHVWSDKLLQEVIHLLLEAYYDPQFSDHSHGFRVERGCHTALREIYHVWKGTTWFIEGDISQCFEKLDHDLLLNHLKRDIQDGRFIRLIRELLEAGYLEEWTMKNPLSGVPQGGIISPLLSNILLDALDKFVETTLIPRYTKGEVRKENPEYRRLIARSHDHRQRGKLEKARKLKQRAQQLPSMDVYDPDYRRLRYVRYADDFLLGFIGPRSEAEEIKQEIGRFLQEELKLELSEAKTLITHARTEAAKFLGYEITIIQQDSKQVARRTNGKGPETKCRSANGRIGLLVPKYVIEEKCQRYMRDGEVVHRSELENESDYTIITLYQLEYRGIVNYYRMAYNLHTLKRLKWVMERSLVKTLAHKLKISVPKVYEKYETDLLVAGRKYKGLQVSILRPEKPPLVATWGGIPLTWDSEATLEEKPPTIYSGQRSELVQRLLANTCELCGATERLEVHHIRAMKDLHRRPGREKPEWARRMIALKRKTMILCRTCHEDVTYGRPLRRQTIELADVKALQKKARQRY